MNRLFGLVPFFLLGACGQQSASRPETDLGTEGNARVASRYREYQEARAAGQVGRCHPGGQRARRVLITGFGPFSGRPANPSGHVVDALGNPGFFPERSSLDTLTSATPGRATPSDRPGSAHGRAMQRTLVFNGQLYEVCTVVASVQWDLASAIFLTEANDFKPHFILMTGLGAERTRARLEIGALNQARRIPGYESDGTSSASGNTPVAAQVLEPVPGVETSIAMTWNAPGLAAAATPALNALNAAERLGANGFHAGVATRIDPANDYICNNVSFVMLHAAKKIPLRLAGGALRLTSTLAAGTRMGFLHYPLQAETSPRQAWHWAHALLGMAEAHFSERATGEQM